MKPLGLLVFLFACGEKSTGDTGSDLDTERAADLWQAIDGYESWGTVEGWEGLVESVDGTHGDFVQIWGNEVALTALAGDAAIPDGGIFVKRGYADAKAAPLSDQETVTVMQKIDGFDSENGDWFWASFYTATGDVAGVAGTSSSCSGCHSVDPDGDFVWFDDLEIPSR